MDVPVVTAAWFEGDIKHSVTHIGQVTVANEELPIGVEFTFRPFAAQGVSLLVEPRTEFIDEFLMPGHCFVGPFVILLV
jgi:hypothetical protein